MYIDHRFMLFHALFSILHRKKTSGFEHKIKNPVFRRHFFEQCIYIPMLHILCIIEYIDTMIYICIYIYI